MKKPATSLFLIALFLTACGGSKDNTNLDRGPILKNIAYNLAIPAYENSLQAFQNLDSALNILETDNSEKNLLSTQSHWKEASINWAKTAPYNFGPIDDLLVENNFHYFPSDTAKLHSALQNFNSDENFINELGSDSRGLGALEFLLFSQKMTLNKSNIAFAKMISHNLVKLNKEILTQWKSEYAESFTASTGSTINSSITRLTNQWIEVTETIKNDKFGLPTGNMTGSEKDTLALQAPFSQVSSAIIEANLAALEISFNGGKEKGMDDYLNALDIKDDENKLLSDKINAQIKLIIELLDTDNQSLTKLIKNDSDKLDRIYLEVLNLSILLKTDMMGQLGLITTFSDSDGD
jgi:hypothetical protein